MAIRTISATGGNWNSVTTWVEGVVPVAGDDVFGVTSSGNLTINVTTAFIKSLDMTYYTGVVSGAGRLSPQHAGTNSVGVAWNVEPNFILGGEWRTTGDFGADRASNLGAIGLKQGPTFVTQSTSFTYFNYNEALTSTSYVKLYSDIYAYQWTASKVSLTTPIIDFGNTYSIYTARFYSPGDGTPDNAGLVALRDGVTATFSSLPFSIIAINNEPTVKGGTISATFSQMFIQGVGNGSLKIMAGTYSNLFAAASLTRIGGLNLASNGAGSNVNNRGYIEIDPGAYFVKNGSGPWDATNAMPQFNACILGVRATDTVPTTIKTNGVKFPLILIEDRIGVTNPRIVIATGSQIITDAVQHAFLSQGGFAGTPYTTFTNASATQSGTVRFDGLGLSASSYFINNNYLEQTASGAVFNTESLVSISPNVEFTSEGIHKIGKFILINGYRNTSYRTTTTTTNLAEPLLRGLPSAATIDIGQFGFAHNYDISNINFTTNNMIATGFATLTSTTGATTSFPSGGGGGGGAFTFVN